MGVPHTPSGGVPTKGHRCHQARTNGGHRQPRCSATARLTARIKMNWHQLLIQDCFIPLNFVSSPAWMSTAPVMDFYSNVAQQALVRLGDVMDGEW